MVEDEWKYKLEGITSFKLPTILCDTLQQDDIMWEGYRPKMLLYTLDKLFYIYNQVKHHRGINEKIIVAYEIISLTGLCCAEHQGWVKKTHMPDAMLLVKLNNTQHLECLAWAVYNGALHVGDCPELLGKCQWCPVLAGISKYIYKGCDETAHCPPYTLVSWDCQQRTDMICEECRAMGQGSRSGSRHSSKAPSQKGWTRFTHSSPPNTLLLKYPGAEELFSPNLDTTPKLSLVVSIPAYARSSHSAEGMVQALLDDDEDWEEEDFQTPHTPVHHVVRQEECSQGESATEQMEASGGSPAWWVTASVDISEEEPETLGEIDVNWRIKWWLEVAAQGIRNEEVPCHNILTLLMSEAEGTAKALAKHLVATWRWNINI